MARLWVGVRLVQTEPWALRDLFFVLKVPEVLVVLVDPEAPEYRDQPGSREKDARGTRDSVPVSRKC